MYFLTIYICRDYGILYGQQPEFSVRAVRSVGRSAGARLHRVVFLELGADRHVLPVQAIGQGVRRRPGASRDRCRAREMFPHAQGQDKLTGSTFRRWWEGTRGIAAGIFFFFLQNIVRYKKLNVIIIILLYTNSPLIITIASNIMIFYFLFFFFGLKNHNRHYSNVISIIIRVV